MAHKTLIIGLGSTGAEIVSHAIDGVVERFGSLENAPWFQAVAFDTADVDREQSVVATNNFEKIGLPSTDYGDFLRDDNRLPQIEFARWSLRDVFLQSNSSSNGASNIRMIGRASFLHPKTFLKFETAIATRVKNLFQVNLAAAMAAAKLPVDNPEHINERSFQVFVVGSLVGGTCSGSFIDAGYFLRDYLKRSGQPGDGFNTVGIFSVPHQTFKGDRRLANVYAALTELNHFLSNGVRYRQKFSTRAQPVEAIGQAPFDSTSLVCPITGEDIDRQKIHAAVGEFVAVAAVSEMAQITWTKTVDPQGNVAARKHKGRHLNFMSLGISSLEYPADHISRACAARLTAESVKAWMNGAGIEPGAADVELDRLELTQDAIRKRLLAPRDGQMDLPSLVEMKLNSSTSQIEADRTGAMATARAQIEEGFQSQPPVADGVGPNVVNDSITRNQAPTRDDYLARFAERIDRALLTTTEGPAWCEGFAQAMLRRVAAIREKSVGAEAHQRAPGLAKKLSEAEARVRESSALKFGPFRNAALAMHAGKWRDISRAYWGARLEDATGQAETDLLARISTFATKVIERLDKDAHNGSLLKVFEQILASSQKEAADLTGKGPLVNGHAIFSAGIVNDDYQEAMGLVQTPHDVHIAPNLRGEERAKAQLIVDFAPLQGCLTGASSAFDKGVDVDVVAATARKPSDVLGQRLRREAMRFFGHTELKDVLKLLYKDPVNPPATAATTVSQVWQLGKPFIEIDTTDSPFPEQEAGVGFLSPAFVFHYQAGSKTWPYAKFESDLRQIEREMPTGNFVPIGDAKRVVVVRAKLGFSAEQIQAVTAYRGASQQETAAGAPMLHSRNDLVWHPINGDPIHPNIDAAIGAFLFGIARGIVRYDPSREGDSFVLPLPANEDEVSISLPDDVELAGYRLLTYADGKGYSYLSRILAEDNVPTRRAEAVLRIHLMKTNHRTMFEQLRYRTAPLKDSDVRDRQLHFARATQQREIVNAYWDGYRSELLTGPEKYFRREGGMGLRPDETPYPAGYYCDGQLHNEPCRKYLMQPGPDGGRNLAEERNFPEKCPNCGNQLLVPGYHEQTRAQPSAVTPVAPTAPSSGDDPLGHLVRQSQSPAQDASTGPASMNDE